MQQAAFSVSSPANYVFLPEPVGVVETAQEGICVIVNNQTNTIYLNGTIHSYSGLNNYQNKDSAKLGRLADPLSAKTYTKHSGKLVIAHIAPARIRALGGVSTNEAICILVPEPYNKAEELPGNSSNRDLRFKPAYLQASATDLLELKLTGSIAYVDAYIKDQINYNSQFLPPAYVELHEYTIECYRQGIRPAISQLLRTSQAMGLRSHQSYIGGILVNDGIEVIKRLTSVAKNEGVRDFTPGSIKPAVALYELTEDIEETHKVTRGLIFSLDAGPQRILASRLERASAEFFDAAAEAVRIANAAHEEQGFPEFAHPTRPEFAGRFAEAILEKKNKLCFVKNHLTKAMHLTEARQPDMETLINIQSIEVKL